MSAVLFSRLQYGIVKIHNYNKIFLVYGEKSFEVDFMLHVAIVEDEEFYREQLEEYIRRYAKEQGIQVMTAVYEDGSQLADCYKPGYDIVLLDIVMKGMSGMETARRIREADDSVVLIFITQMSQYAIDGYAVGALDYILKPVDYEGFSMHFSAAVTRVQNRSSKTIMLPLPSGMVRLRTEDIYYVEVQNHDLHYYTVNGVYRIRGTMQGAEKMLAPYFFVRSNYWYLVNLAHVSEIDRNIVVVGGYRLEISRRNRADFMKAVTDYIGGNS